MALACFRGTTASLVAVCLAGSAIAQTGKAPSHHEPATQHPVAATPRATASLDWDQAFTDTSGRVPLHFTAMYRDAAGNAHHLEEWRIGQTHLRRRTDDRIDLHADATHALGEGQPVDYRWQVLDLQKKIDHRISSEGMLRLGMLYSYYSMAHVLTRPAAAVQIHAVPGLTPLHWKNTTARWFDISVAGTPVARVCWDATLGIPLRTLQHTGSGWTENFRLTASDTHVSPASFTSDTTGFQVRDAAEMDTD